MDGTEKEQKWHTLAAHFYETADCLGHPIDPGIKETVIALNVLGLPTIASCEGHTDHGISAPWVEIALPGEPEEHFAGEKKIYEEIAKKYGVPFEDVKRGTHAEAWLAALREASKNQETTEHLAWQKANTELMRTKIIPLLEEFYKDRVVSDAVRISVSEGIGAFRIYNGGHDYAPVPEPITEGARRALAARIKIYRAEMAAFAEFVKQKFFSG